MNRIRLFIFAVPMILVACHSVSDKDTIAKLRHMQIEIKEEKIEGGLDKAMLSYRRFLEETPDSPLTPEAIRRLADLKIEKEYGTFTDGAEAVGQVTKPLLPAPEPSVRPKDPLVTGEPSDHASANIPDHHESEADFERRTTREQHVAGMAAAADVPVEGADDLERAGAREAIELYTKLLNDYPLYERNDQVLYQMSRAYEELGQIKEAMAVMERMVHDFSRSRYIDEVQFRRAEYFFAHRRYLDAEDAYASVVNIGVASSFYELALYKLGWTFYKQELYDDAIHRFIALLDHKVSIGYDFEQTEDEQEHKRTEDTFRVISLSFSNLGGSDSVVEYFSDQGKRSYEDSIYSNLGEFYFDKRRYADAAATYNAFVSRNPFHKVAPNFHMRVIEIQAAGGFPSLVLDAKKEFATTYGLKSEYWKYFDPSDRPDVLGYLKTNLTDLANHYHACYQDPKQTEKKSANFEEALHWYRGFLTSFPMDSESPTINYQLANLLLENRSFGAAAMEFEKTAYGYPTHEKSSQAGYVAVSARREQLKAVSQEDKDTVKREIVSSSLKFVDTFPEHEKAAIVLGAAADDLYGMKEYEQALAAANKLFEVFPGTDSDVVRSAWLVVGHSSYELLRYSEAETAYLNVLALLPEGDKTHDELVDNLAASIYKQGEGANSAQDYQAAADHFLRVSRTAPTSKIRPTAEYDAAAALIQLKDWKTGAAVLTGFRNSFPEHSLQPEVTKKIAYVYRENGQLSMAASEYERIEKESKDDEIRRDALLVAAELHEQDGNSTSAFEVYRRYVEYFPEPVELNLETRNKISGFLKAQGDFKSYLNELEKIVAIDASAGSARTPRTRYLAAQAALVLAEKRFDAFVAVKLSNPFEVNLRKKRELMKEVTQKFNQLVDYEIGEFTAAATFYLAEIYAHFSKALMTSERPVLTFDYYMVKPGDNLSTIAKRYDSDVRRIARENNLNKSNFIVEGKKLKIPRGLYPLELEQYELAIEEQAYPFEEKAITVHESNLKLVSRGIYNEWIEKSLEKLAEFMPARYDKPEETSGIVSSLETYIFEIARPESPAEPVQVNASESIAESEASEPAEAEGVEPATASEPAEPVEAVESGTVTESEASEPAEAEEAEPATASEPAEPVEAVESGTVTESEPSEPAEAEGVEPATASEPAEPVEAVKSGTVNESEPSEPAEAEEAEPATASEPAEPVEAEESGTVTESEPSEPVKAEGAESVMESEPEVPAQIEEAVQTDRATRR
ncbi:MAG: tetratricopeptide repeat protein [Desulfobacterales bacterium]